MDPRDRPFDLVDGAECAACGRPVPLDQVRILARREDLAFAELPCLPCGSTSLAIFVGRGAVPGFLGEEPAPVEDPGDPSRPAVDADDVLEMHLFLDRWSGDLRSLVDRGAIDGDDVQRSA